MLACMFGPGIRTVFTSRWKALLWSLGILSTAYCSIPSDDQTGGADDAAKVASAVIGVAGQGGSGAASAGDASQAANPWK